MTVDRKPAIASRRHPGEDLPERPATPAPQSVAPSHTRGEVREPQPAAEEPSEKFSEQLNTKMRPSTRAALYEAISVHQFLTGTKLSIQAIVDAAVLEYINNHNLHRPS